MNYTEIEKYLFDKLIDYRKGHPGFNFSVRRKAAKGAELDYFIGTSKSNYFGFTFWDIPIYFPGSSGDLLDFIIHIEDGMYYLKFQAHTSKKTTDAQTKTCLKFCEELSMSLEAKYRNTERFARNKSQNAMYYTHLKGEPYECKNPEILWQSFIKLYEEIKPIVDKTILDTKKEHPKWQAEALSDSTFDEYLQRMSERMKRIAGRNVVLDPGVGSGSVLSGEGVKQPLNQILFGPPGTGKTYNTVNRSLEIIDNIFYRANKSDRSELKSHFDKLMRGGQIQFVTFHQSMSYEDFIEGIKPKEPEEGKDNVHYIVMPGIFKQIAIEASFEFVDKKQVDTKLQFSEIYDSLLAETSEKLEKGEKIIFKSKADAPIEVTDISDEDNFQVKHKDGTRPYTVSKRRLSILHDAIADLREISNVAKEFKAIIGGSNSSAYWSVLSEIKKRLGKTQPKAKDETYQFSFEEKESLVGRIDWTAINKKIKRKNYVLIIDEINRGNVSQIFGELITLIEEDKRLGNGEALHLTLPYSKKSFAVPPNLYLVGTMNTADRSVEALDSALRRRFSFIHQKPDETLLHPKALVAGFWNNPLYYNVDWNEEPYKSSSEQLYDLLGIEKEIVEKPYINITFEDMEEVWDKENLNHIRDIDFRGVRLDVLLRIINLRIEKLLDADHTIGHAFFINTSSIDDLKRIFSKSIIPLLQEYFFGDYGKIGLVLGELFFEIQDDVVEEDFFASFDEYQDRNELAERKIWKLKDVDKMSEDEFKQAVISIYTPAKKKDE